MNFMYLVRFSTSSVIKLVSDNDDVVEDTLYGLTSMTSLFSTTPFSSFFSSSTYNSWISQILLSMYLLPFPLY